MDKQLVSQFQADMTDSYDQFFGTAGFGLDDNVDAGFGNIGLFLPETPNHTAACENMMERLMALICHKRGLILDAGCGLGGPARYITRYYPPEQLYGINISEFQLSECRRRVPNGNFLLMPAEQLSFPDNMFDTVISVEASPHFKGRREFLREAYRVLKPGGELVVADILFNSQPKSFKKVLTGQELYQNIGEYRELWKACGYRGFSCEETTEQCWNGFTEYTKKRIMLNVINKQIDMLTFQRLIKFVKKFAELPVMAYVLAHAWKPE